MKFVLCVLAALGACCDKEQLCVQDQACALAAQGNAPESARFPPWMLGEGSSSYSVGGFILHSATFLHHFSSGFLNQLADFSLTWKGRGWLDIKVLSSCVEMEVNQREFPVTLRQNSLPFSKEHNYFKFWTAPYAAWSQALSFARLGAIAINLQIIFSGLLTFLAVFPLTDIPHLLSCSCPHASHSASQKRGRELSSLQGGPRGLGRQPEVTLEAEDLWKRRSGSKYCEGWDRWGWER